MKLEDLTLDIEQHLDIKAKPEKVFASVLHRLGKGNTRPDGVVMDMNLEPTAGGKWYRDRGNGISHLWGFVQSIKPGELIELSGPMFMSYPALNHLEIKIEPAGNGSKLHFRHRALGMIDPEHRKGVVTGWTHMLNSVKQDSEKA
jgi:Activator of Hsp90 ATPase homolog 1-like protein